MIDPYLIVDRCLTDAERERFMRRFTHHNPHWRGAHVADVLAVLADGDADLRMTERAYEALDGDRSIPEQWKPLFVPCAHAVTYTQEVQRSPEEYCREVRDLVKRCGGPFDLERDGLAGRHD